MNLSVSEPMRCNNTHSRVIGKEKGKRFEIPYLYLLKSRKNQIMQHISQHGATVVTAETDCTHSDQ